MMFWIFLKLNPKLELNIEEVNLYLFRQAIDLFHQAKKNIYLVLNLNSTYFADLQSEKQVMVNLSNALKLQVLEKYVWM
jgi:hypothetical protein